MANVIKHKRGSGSDPAANNLVLGELAIRTDTGKLFTKMDSGAIAEIAGGGSDIAINTLSSSSGTGGGSATFNGSAYRFTLSAPPSVSAQQLLVSINGVIQKPVAGTGQPSEGFSVDGTDIILGDAPATGSDFFILTFKSLGVSEPADNSVTSAKIVDGAIVNADINASAAIAGTKISPDFGSQNIVTTGSIGIGVGSQTPSTPQKQLHIAHDSSPRIMLSNDTTGHATPNGTELLLDSNGNFEILQRENLNLEFFTNGSQRMTINGSGNVGIGTTSPSRKFVVTEATGNRIANFTTGGSSGAFVAFLDSNTTDDSKCRIGTKGGNDISLRGDSHSFQDGAGSDKMHIDSSGNVGIGTTSPATQLEVKDSTDTRITITAGNAISQAGINFADNSGVDGICTYDHNTRKLHLGAGTSSFTDGDLTIDSSGKVGIGTTSPGDFHSKASNLVIHSSGDTGMTISSGTSSDGRIFFADGTSGSAESEGHIRYDHATDSMHFATSDTGVFTLDASGNIILTSNTTSKGNIDNGSSSGAYFNTAGQLNTSRSTTSNSVHVNFNNPNNTVGTITTSGTSTSFNTSGSDRTLKKNFEVWNEDILSIFKNINPQKFNFICEDDSIPKTKGFIAQDLVDYFPEAYPKNDETDKYWFNPSGMVVYLMKALQEAVARIEALEAK